MPYITTLRENLRGAWGCCRGSEGFLSSIGLGVPSRVGLRDLEGFRVLGVFRVLGGLGVYGFRV